MLDEDYNPNGNSFFLDHVRHQLAVTYCVHAICTQETNANSEVRTIPYTNIYVAVTVDIWDSQLPNVDIFCGLLQYTISFKIISCSWPVCCSNHGVCSL